METSAQGQMEILRLLRDNPNGMTRDQLFDQSTVYTLSQSMSGDIRLLQQQMSIVRFGANIYTLVENEAVAREFHMTDAERVETQAEFDRKIRAKALASQPKVKEPEPANWLTAEQAASQVLDARPAHLKVDTTRITMGTKIISADPKADVQIELDQVVVLNPITLPPLVSKEIERPATPLAPAKPLKHGGLYRTAVTGKVAMVVYTHGRHSGISINDIASYLPGISRTDVSRVCSQLSLDCGGKYNHYFDKVNEEGRRDTLLFIWSKEYDYPFRSKLSSDIDLIKSKKINVQQTVVDQPEASAYATADEFLKDNGFVPPEEAPSKPSAAPEHKPEPETFVFKPEAPTFLAALYTTGELQIGFGTDMITLTADQTLQVAKLLRGLV